MRSEKLEQMPLRNFFLENNLWVSVFDCKSDFFFVCFLTQTGEMDGYIVELPYPQKLLDNSDTIKLKDIRENIYANLISELLHELCQRRLKNSQYFCVQWVEDLVKP